MTPEERQEIAQLREDVGNRISNDDGAVKSANLDDESVTLAKIAAAAFAAPDAARAGVGDGVMSSPLVAAAIGALAGHVTKQIFAASANFQREDDDIFYFVEAWGGGGSGQVAHTTSTVRITGGNGGAYNCGFVIASDLPTGGIVPVEVGAGGIPVSVTVVNTRNLGVQGGISRFGNFLQARGGAGGGTDDVNAGFNREWFGGGGGYGETAGGSSIKAGAGGAGSFISSSTQRYASGGVSDNGGKGGMSGAVGQDGVAPGGGGGSAGRSAGSSAGPSGAGGRGEVRVTRFKRRKPI